MTDKKSVLHNHGYSKFYTVLAQLVFRIKQFESPFVDLRARDFHLRNLLRNGKEGFETVA